jgi:hypothetical protein
MTKQAQSHTTVAPIGAAMFGVNTPADIDSVVNHYAAWLEDLGRVQQESLEFVRARLERDAEAATRMVACKTPAELMEWQISFTKDAVEDYMRQGQRITSLLMQSTNGAGTRGARNA